MTDKLMDGQVGRLKKKEERETYLPLVFCDPACRNETIGEDGKCTQKVTICLLRVKEHS